MGNHSRIITGADKLLVLIQKHGELSLNQAAQQLMVNRDIVDTWADSLEEGGAVYSELTIGGRNLFSPEFHKSEIKGMKNFLKQLRSMPHDMKGQKDKMVSNKLKELNRRIHLMDKKSKELRKYAEVRKDVEEKASRLKKFEEELRTAEDQLRARHEAIKEQHVFIAHENKRVKERDCMVAQKLDELSAKTIKIKAQEAVLVARQEEIDRSIARIIKVSGTAYKAS